jgi:hypothetical protein
MVGHGDAMTQNILWDRGGDLPVQLVTNDPLPISCRESFELYRSSRHAFLTVQPSTAACALV